MAVIVVMPLNRSGYSLVTMTPMMMTTTRTTDDEEELTTSRASKGKGAKTPRV
jgi:hypothetical protein